MPTGSWYDQLPQHFSLFVCHLILGLILICTHDALRWQWDWLAIDGLSASHHLCLAADSFAIILLDLLVFGLAVVLSLLPILVLIAMDQVVSRWRLPRWLPCSVVSGFPSPSLSFFGSDLLRYSVAQDLLLPTTQLIGLLPLVWIGAWATIRWATAVGDYRDLRNEASA